MKAFQLTFSCWEIMEITNELIVKREVDASSLADVGQEEIIDGFSFFSFEYETDLRVN